MGTTMQFIKRLFMDPSQRALANPDDYRKPLDVDQIIKEVKSGKAGITDPEAIGYMVSAADSFEHRDKPLTIEGCVDDVHSLTYALKREGDRSLREFGIGARLGSDFLASYLIRRANQIAATIRPGAQQGLGGAFGA